MKHQNNTFLMAVGALIILFLCIGAASFVGIRVTEWTMSETFENDAATVANVGDSIADYTLPAEFGDGYAVRWEDFSMVAYTADGNSHIYLVQVPESLLPEHAELEQQMRQVSGQGDFRESRVIGRQPCPIRGEPTTLIISEGINHTGQLYRSASALFEGNEGTALINISGPADTWDQEMVETFIESVK